MRKVIRNLDSTIKKNARKGAWFSAHIEQIILLPE